MRTALVAPWRDPVENVIVYRWASWFGSRRIMIANQDNGASEEVLEKRLAHCATPWSRGIAERYFDAHPIEAEIHEGESSE